MYVLHKALLELEALMSSPYVFCMRMYVPINRESIGVERNFLEHKHFTLFCTLGFC